MERGPPRADPPAGLRSVCRGPQGVHSPSPHFTPSSGPWVRPAFTGGRESGTQERNSKVEKQNQGGAEPGGLRRCGVGGKAGPWLGPRAPLEFAALLLIPEGP